LADAGPAPLKYQLKTHRQTVSYLSFEKRQEDANKHMDANVFGTSVGEANLFGKCVCANMYKYIYMTI
jgi:hypothetical protein